MINRSTGIVATLCIVGLLGSSSARGQSLADAAAKERERRRKAAESTVPASPASPAKAAPVAGGAPTEVHTESWWRSHSRTHREAVADAEAQVKYYQARIDEAKAPQPSATDSTQPAAPPRVMTEAEKREAEASLATAQRQLAAARKQMQDLEDQARREQVPAEWLR